MTEIPDENLKRNSKYLDFTGAIYQALQRRPEITESIAMIAGQSASIDVAKAAYYPQISGGITTADLTSGERGRQLLRFQHLKCYMTLEKLKDLLILKKLN